MEYRRLGQTDLNVSVICLGTMTWGQQNTEAEAHQQLDFALERGVNFIDTAEMYPVPAMAETQGRTEAYIGSWLAARKNRDRILLATKVAGPGGLTWIRENLRLDRKNIMQAVEGSLKRLQTDYIDLYQLHWPDRETNFFGQLSYRHREDDASVPIEETMGVMAELVQSGKIRHVGISNETPWGMMRYLELARTHGFPRIVSIQNPYSLLNRTFEIGLSEIAIREDCGLLAYSPMAFGILSGKYLESTKPQNARLTLFNNFTRYWKPEADAVVPDYVRLAREHGLSPAQMALAFVNQQRFVTSNIIGATTMAQLKENIDSIDIKLSPDLLAAIDAIHTRQPNPCP